MTCICLHCCDMTQTFFNFALFFFYSFKRLIHDFNSYSYMNKIRKRKEELIIFEFRHRNCSLNEHISATGLVEL